MSRPGPLQEHPLKLFLKGNPNLGPNLNNKRPLSPSSHSSHHPKRRILDAAPRSSKTPSSARASRFAEPVDYASILSGPGSPARVLDFGAPRQPQHLAEEDDPQRTPQFKHPQELEHQLTPSPKLRARTTPRASTSADFSTAPKSTASHPAPIHPLVFQVVPRELPLPTDPESDHYPGFAVYRDPHTLIARRDESRTLESLADPDEEPEKENTVPPREIRKLTSMFADVHTKSVSPGKGKQRMTPDDLPLFSLNHKRIFGNGFEDDLADLSASYGLSRRSRLTSALLDDNEPSYGSPLWQAHGDGDGDGLLD